MEKFISWIEIPSTNFERAVKFYQSIFNIDMKTIYCGQEKMACFSNGEGAISYVPGFKPSKNGVLISLNAGANLDFILNQIEKLGGKIVKSKTKIDAEERGYFAIFIDSEGNKIGLYSDL